MHSAGAALAMITTFLRAGEGNGLANAIQQRCASINSHVMIFAVNPQCDWDGTLNSGLIRNSRARFVRVTRSTSSNDGRRRAASHCQEKFPAARV